MVGGVVTFCNLCGAVINHSVRAHLEVVHKRLFWEKIMPLLEEERKLELKRSKLHHQVDTIIGEYTRAR